MFFLGPEGSGSAPLTHWLLGTWMLYTLDGPVDHGLPLPAGPENYSHLMKGAGGLARLYLT